ncbi:Hsp20/alpha crystallin family protein [bacterium 1XD42-8]|jgi:HSP20 family protein|nr:Hsp20/alpha crystallin family protein [Lachnospiraceae bacterium]RKJ42329.1 Hsp20/alpha crystallin family protein [bacterium 1XD42-8]
MFIPTLFERKPSLFENSLEKMYQDFWNNSYSTIEQFNTDIIEKDDHYLLQAEIPGFNKEEIQISLQEDVLTISACHKEEKNTQSSNHYVRRERRYASYSRSFHVQGINAKDIDASYNNGILEVTFPKQETEKPEPKRIEIR